MKRNHYTRFLCRCIGMLLFTLYAPWAIAQDIAVSGKVTGQDTNTGLPGVNVVVKGTTNGTTTNADGIYTISAPANSTLVFSFIGYVAEEVNVGSRTTIDMALAPDIKALSEVVVIGYGERERKDLTGSISQIGSETIQKSAPIQPELAMQGRMAGVFVSTPGGSPNARPQVRIRGVGTFNNAEPLYVVDGIPLVEFGSGDVGGGAGDLRGSVNILNTINPNDIESISVLKDASAAAIYGVRAANGVILITTKKGQKGKPRVDFSASRGVQNLPKTYDVLNTPQYVQLYQEAVLNRWEYDRFYAPNADPDIVNPLESTAEADVKNWGRFNPNNPLYLGNNGTYDWQNELINRNAIIEDYSVRVSGGSESTTYYTSIGYGRQESPLVQNYLERYSLATSINTKISKFLEAGLTYRLGYNNALDNTVGNLSSASQAPPWQPIYNADHPTGYAPVASYEFELNPDYDESKVDPGSFYNLVSANRLYGEETATNFFAYHKYRETRYNILRNLGTAFLQVEPIRGLRFRGTLSGDYNYNRRNSWNAFEGYLFTETPANPYTGRQPNYKGVYGENHGRTLSLTKEFTINFARSFGQHNVDVILNASDQSINTEFISGSSGVLFSEEQFRGIVNDDRWNGGFSNRAPYALQGYMGRLSYSFANKYYLDATVRRDGSSNFAPDYRWGTFPAFSAAWRISSEEFFKNLTFINDLKIRGGYGIMGNQNLGPVGFPNFPYLSLISTTTDASFGSGNGDAVGSVRQAAYLSNFAVPNISWERAKTYTFGFDGAFLNNKLTFTAEYYNRDTEGILQSVDLPASAGIPGSTFFNIGNVRNSGVELQLGYTQNIGKLQLSFNGNFTTVRNRVVSLYNDQPLGGESDRKEEGQVMNYIWGHKVGGIFQTQAEVDEWIAQYEEANGQNPRPGDLYFQDLYGNPESGQFRNPVPDGRIDDNDRTYLGKTIAGHYYGFSVGANYKGFDLSLFFQGVGDVQKINSARRSGEGMGSFGLNQWTSTDERWTPENPSTSMPRAIYGDPFNNGRMSDRWVEDAGFMRLKNFQLGYSLPQNLLTRIGFLERLRVFVSGTNVFTLTQYTGLDPENDDIPPARMYSVGLNATFY